MAKINHQDSNVGSVKHAYKKQSGVAIITALLIVAIATTVSITISTRLQLDVRRTSNIISLDQVDFFLLEAEEWSQRILRKDKEDSTSDDLTEDWAIRIPPLPVDGGGTIQGALTDLHACININTLINNDGAINAATEAQLTRLFTNLGITTNLTTALADWIDGDLDTPNSNGAEDGYYMNLEKPYRTANTPLRSITELQLVKGFDEKTDTDSKTVYQLVSPYLCAYKTSGNLLINVNTASAEVLQSLATGMTQTLVDSILKQREETPFTSKEDFTSFSNLKTIITDTDQITVNSEYFLLRSQAIIGQANKVMYSIIFRDASSGATEVIFRTQRTL